MGWRVVKVFQDLDIRVSVSESDHSRPCYSLSVWKVNGEDVYRFFPIRFKGKGKLELAEPSSAPIVARLWAQGEQWCLEKAQERENEIIEELRAHEIAQLAREKPAKRGGTHQ